jgi:serine/threonine protein kinase
MSETPVIPGYRIESRLGQGGMATVYLAIQESFEREVALKVMSPLLNSDPSFAERFKREARIVAQLSHASIVPVFDVGEHQSFHYLSMEYLPAGELKRRILDRENDIHLALKVCIALSSALETAHRKGFVHRDIKPENILFREDGTPVLTDFGIARALDSGRSMTLAGMLVGTPDYMSPEQVKGLELDGRSDLYSLGIVFYEVLTGSVPFKADSTLSVALKQVGEPLPLLPPEYAEYQEFLDCLTAKNREERFASGAEVVRALRLISAGRSVRDRTQPPMNPTPAPVSTTPAPVSTESYVSGPTLARPRMAGASGGVAAVPPNATAPRLVGLAEPRNPTLVEGGGEGHLESPPAMGAQGSSQSKPQHAARPLRYEAAADILRNRRLWPAGAGVAAAAICIILIFIAKPHKSIPTAVSAPPQLNTAVPLSAHPTSTASQPDASAATETATATATVARSVESKSPSADAISATTAAARAEAEARRKRQLEERQQRKAEAARLAAEAKAAQLAAQEAQIQDLLAAAKTQYAAGALWQPTGSSAADSYRAILTMQPQRAEALAGMQRVADVLADEAEDAEASGNLDSSRQLIDQVQSLQPFHRKLPALQARFQQLQSSPTALDARDRSRLEKAAKYIARAVENLDRKPMNFKSLDDATDQYDKALSTAPQSPGLPSLKERLIAAYPAAVQTALDEHDTKRAQKLIGSAHKRNLSSPELDQLEATLQGASTPAAGIKEAGAR